MRNSKICAKCRSAEILRIPGDVRAYGAIRVGATIFSAVKVTRYLCAACGFSEEWIDSADDIANFKSKYGSE